MTTPAPTPPRGDARPWLVDLAEDQAYEVLTAALRDYADELRHRAEGGGEASMLTHADRAEELLAQIEEALDS